MRAAASHAAFNTARHLGLRGQGCTVRSVRARADRRGGGKSSGKAGGSDKRRDHKGAEVSGTGREQRREARNRDLQRAARLASARAEGIGPSRLALQERLASQASESDDEDDGNGGWAAGTEGRGTRDALSRGQRGGPPGASTGPRRRSAGADGAKAKDEDAELWPSLDAIKGPPSHAAGDSTASAPGSTGATSGGGVQGQQQGRRREQQPGSGGAGGEMAGLVAALRAAAAADREAKWLSGEAGGGRGGSGGLIASLRGALAAGTGGRAAGGVSRETEAADGGSTAGGSDAALVPYVDVVLKELGLPPRLTGRRGAARLNVRPSGSADAASGSSDAEEDEDDDEDEDALDGDRRGNRRARGGGRSRGAKRGALRELLEAYQRVWTRALDLELQEEWTESEERLKSWKRPRLEAEGFALFDLTSASDHNLFRDAVLRFFVPGRPLPYHCLGAGDIVLVSPNNRPSESSLEGVVLDFSNRWIRVALPADLAQGVQGGGWRLDLYANTIAHERARGAVKRFCQAAAESGNGSSSPGSKSGSAGGGNGNSSDGADTSAGGGSLGILRALAGSVPPGTTLEQLAAAQPSWLKGKAGKERLTSARRVVAAAAGGEEAAAAVGATAVAPPEERVAAAALPVPSGVSVDRTAAVESSGADGGGRRRAAGLNPSQARAIETALGRTLTLWQGPPGTGKTATLLHFIRAARAALPRGLGPLLATAASNVAVDNLVSGLRALDPSLDVVRVGQPVKVAPELRGVSLEARIAGSSSGQRAARLRKQAQGLRGSEAWAYISQALELEEAAARDILAGAHVVAATCIGCGEARLQAMTFPVVVLDEATQATEPHALVPLLNQTQQVVLVGDPQQLPPTVKSEEASGLGLQMPLFERLQLMGLAPLLLDTQYRMHPSIAAFPSAAFYAGKLRSAPTPRDRRPPAAFPWPNPKVPVCFIPVRGKESRTASANDAATPGGSAGFSYQNDQEAAAVVAVVGALLTPGSGLQGPGDIGVITPYNGQVRCLQQLLNHGPRVPRGMGIRPGSFMRASAASLDDDLPYGRGSPAGPGSGPSAREEAVLEIKSVDGFQGREKEVIVFSAVRSNPERRLGFVSDPRRLNVAITRARRGLVVLGNPDTLSADRLWARWLRWAQSQGCIMDGGFGARAAEGPRERGVVGATGRRVGRGPRGTEAVGEATEAPAGWQQGADEDADEGSDDGDDVVLL